MLYKNFIAGRMNLDADERTIPNGEYRSATNVEIINSESSDVGAIENTLSTKQLTNINLGANPRTIGKYSDEPEDRLYWFVKSDTGTFLIEWDDINQVASIVLHDTRTEDVDRVLNLKEDKLITGIWKVVSEDTKKDLLIFTDDNIEPCCINIERAKTWGENGFEAEDIYLMKKQPKFAPKAIPTYSAEESNYIEERFVSFAYRYKYLDGERSAISTYSNYNFNPKKFKMDYQSMENIGMVNNFNAVRLSFDTGPKQVTDIEIIAKESNSNVLSLVSTFNKKKEGWGNDQEKDFVFSNNKIYDVIEETELFRTFDNVPRKAKAFALIENVPVFGNYLEGYDIKTDADEDIRMDYSVGILSNDLTGTVLSTSLNANKDQLTFTIPSSIELKQSFRLVFDLQMMEINFGGNYADFVEFILPKDFIDADDLAINEDFKFFIETLMTKRFLAELDIDIPANYSQTGETSFSVVSSTSTSITISAIIVDYTVDNSPSPNTTDNVEFEFSTSTVVSHNTLESFASCKTNRSYEVGIIYQDKWTRKSTVLTGNNNTVYVPQKFSVKQNKLLVNINNPAPYWADSYKVVVKANPLQYQTLYGTVFYPDGLFRWVKLEGANKDKVKEGDTLIVKSDLSGPIQDVIKTRVIEVSSQPADFIEGNTNENDVDIPELSGLYMKIKPHGYDMAYTDNTIINIDQLRSAGKNRQEKFSNDAISDGFFGDATKITNWKNNTDNNALKKPAIVVPDFNDFNEDGTFKAKLPVVAGSQISIYLRVYEDGIGTVGEYEKDFIAASPHDDIKAWFEEEVVDLGGQNDKFDINFEEGPGGEIRLLVQGNNTGSASSSKQSKLVVRIDVVLVEGLMIFETEPLQAEQSLFYETEQTFDIESGLHKANLQDQTISLPATIELDFFNCFVQGNGAESFRVKDAPNANFLNIDLKPSTTSIEPYREVRRFADLTYGEPFVESTNFNGLNAFNLSKINFKELDKQYGSIQILFSRDTNLVVLQEDKALYVLFGKDLLLQANGVSAISTTPEILGQEIPYQGDNGIGKNPESFAWDAFRMYYVNPRRGAPIRLSQDGTSEINYGTIAHFRDLFINNPTSNKIGGFDPYHKKYVLTSEDEVTENFKSFCGNSIYKTVSEPFTYDFELNELVGDITLDYTITGGNVTIEAVFDGNNNVESNVTGTGQLTFVRNNLSAKSVQVTVTPVSGNPIASITNLCPTGSQMKVFSIVRNDNGDVGTNIINRYKRANGQFFSTNDSLTVNGLSKFLEETSLEGVGKFPANSETITIQSYKDGSTSGNFYAERGNRIGYLVSDNVYTEADLATILAAATFITTTKTTSGTISETNSGTFVFNRPSENHHLYLIYDYTDGVVDATNDTLDIFEGEKVNLNVLFNDTNTYDNPTVEVIGNPTNGVAYVQADNSITYIHNGSSTVSDSITYRVFNGSTYDTATITVTIAPDPNAGTGGTGGGDNGRNFLMSSSSYDSPNNQGDGACEFSVNQTKYHDGASVYPTLDDYVFDDQAKNTPFNGGGRYYAISGGKTILIASNGRILDVWACGVGGGGGGNQ